MNDDELITTLSQPCYPEALQLRARESVSNDVLLLQRACHPTHTSAVWQKRRGSGYGSPGFESVPLASPAFHTASLLPQRRLRRIIRTLQAIKKLAQ